MAEYQLKVGGSEIPLGTAPPPLRGKSKPSACLESIRVAYEEPRELRLRWYGPPILNQDVELRVDDVVRFAGKALTRRFAPGIENNDLVTAFGYEELIKNLDVRDELTGYPLLGFPAGSTLREILTKLVTQSAGPELAQLGISADFVGATDEVVPDYNARGLGLADALSVLTNSVPGFTWLIAPDTKTLNIVLPFNAPAITLTIGKDQILAGETELTESLRDRYTAVRLIGQAVESATSVAFSLSREWDSSLESEWKYDDGGAAVLTDGKASAAQQRVFRRFGFGPVKDEILFNEEVRLIHAVDKVGGGTEYVSIEIGEVDADNGYVWAKLPVVRPVRRDRGGVPNPRGKGKCEPPAGVFLAYQAATQPAIPGLRVPLSGFTGTAKTAYGLEREKVVYEESNENLDSRRALRTLDVSKDVLYEGRIALAGDVPSGIWNLAARLNLAIEGATSALGNAHMILRAFEHRFDQGRTVLEVGTDKTTYMGEVAS